MTNFVFKILDFPENVQRGVLRSMKYSELVIFSIISTKTKNIVQSLNVKALSLLLVVYDSLEFKVNFSNGTSLKLVFTDPRQEEQPQSPWPLIHEPQNLSIIYRTAGIEHEETIRCQNPGYGFKKLVDHLKSIFQFSRPSMLVFHNRELIKVEDVWETFWDLLDYVVVNHLINDAFAQRVLEACISKTRKLILLRQTPLNGAISMALQNLDVLTSNRIRDLDDLLLCNSSGILTVATRFSFNLVNRFLRSWARGSNRRLEFIDLPLSGDVAPEMSLALKGLTYRNVAEGKVRRVSENVRGSMSLIPADMRVEEVRGGTEIRNKFGIVATVRLVHGEMYNAIQMFVWH